MLTLRKTIKLTLLCLLIIIGIIFLDIIIEGNIYGYKEEKYLFKPEYLNPFCDSIKDRLKIQECYTNSRNDSLFLLEYNNEIRIIYWKLEQYKDVKLQILHHIKSNLIQSNIDDYSNIIASLTPLVQFKAKMKLPIKITPSLYFDKNSIIKKEYIGSNYLYYYLTCYEIGFTSDQKYFDLVIRKEKSSSTNLLLYNSKNTLYLIMLYSLKNRTIDSNLIFKLFKLGK